MSTLGRRIVGLIAAYAIALQAVLAVGSLLAAGTMAAGALCVASESSAPVQPGHHTNEQCCLAMGCHAATGVAPDIVAAVEARYPDQAILIGASPAVNAGAAIGTASWPRAPPV